MKKGISLVGIRDLKTIEQIRTEYPDAWFELSYLSTEELLKQQMPLIEGRIASLHMLCPMREFFPNIADKDSYKWSENQILKDAEYGAKLGAEVLVLHPGYKINGLMYTDDKKRLNQSGTSKNCTADYLKSPDYLFYFSTMAENALKLTEKVRQFGLKLAIENLNPRINYLVIHPDEMVYLASLGLDLNLDVGHLELSSAVLGFDYYKELKRIVDTGRVAGMHLHSNESCNGILKDSHCSFDKYLDYKKILSIVRDSESNLIIESLEEPLHNVSLLFED